MRTLMLKIVIAMCLLFCALLYGMNMVKDNMVQMNGKKALNTKASVLDVHTLKRLSRDPKLAHSSEKNAMKSTRVEKKTGDMQIDIDKRRGEKVARYPSIEERLDHLKAIDTFNPFSTLGDKMSQGVSTVFSGGMEAVANLLDGLVESIL